MTSTTVTAQRITTGFLSGNLLNDTTGLDVPATIAAYRDALEDAISQAYPEAEVEVRWQDAEGSLPADLRTRIAYSDGEEIEEGDSWPHDKIADLRTVDDIAGTVFERGDWYVEEAR